MSQIFEGIVCRMLPEKVGSLSRQVFSKTKLQLGLSELGDSVYAVYRNDDRTKSAFVPEMDRLGKELSLDIRDVLVARYDSRSGHVSSTLYKNGTVYKAFDEDDEIYVLLDEDGTPLVNGQQFQYADLDPNEEYDTLYNAIQLGLEEMRLAPVWPRLLELINNQGLASSTSP